jgi:Rrf2 family iron-sulfur cluster assembly transcriptional regulator
VRLIRAGEYAVRCVLYMCTYPKGNVVSKREISEAMEIPMEFLGKIAKQLKRVGIFEIVQGAKGGFRLLRDPKKITLLEVVEAVIGEIFLNDCIMNPDSCRRSSHCKVHRVWEEAKDQLRERLRSVTFMELASGESCLLPPKELSKTNREKGG